MALETRINEASVRPLIDRLDCYLFGKRGSLAGSIQAQGRGGAWKPLTDEYYDWKEWMLGDDIPGEPVPPREVISTDIWIRTGKTLEFCQTRGKGRLKTIKIHPANILSGFGPFYEVYLEQIDYPIYANKARPLFEFVPEDEEHINRVVFEWFTALLASIPGMGGEAVA